MLIDENPFENIVCEIAAILSREIVNSFYYVWRTMVTGNGTVMVLLYIFTETEISIWR